MTLGQPRIILEIKDLELTYAQTQALKKITFSVNHGEFLIIIGPNGSGKTSLLKCLARLNKFQGKITLADQDLEKFSRKHLARTMAYLPQNPQDEFNFTVQEMVLMGRSPYLGPLGLEKEKDLALAQKTMEMTNIAHLAQKKIKELSGGERQRVFLARGLCQKPAIFLLDEPTSALDLAHQVQVMDLLTELKEKKKLTIIMVVHDLNLAGMYADRLLLLSKGEIVKIGPVQEVLCQKLLEKAFACPIIIEKGTLGNCPRVLTVPQKYKHYYTRLKLLNPK